MTDGLIYIEDFLNQRDAAELYDYIRNNIPVVRPRNARQGGKYAVRRMSYPGYAPNEYTYRNERGEKNRAGSLIDAPPLYQNLSTQVTAFAGESFNYASTIAYQKSDWMRPHQHFEDRKRVDQRVIVLSMGSVHPVQISYGATVYFPDPKTGKRREKFVPNGLTETIFPASGSIYLLPTRFNQPGSRGEAQHAVLPGDENGLRISINLKSIPPNLNDEDFCEACSRPPGRTNATNGSLFVREPGPPRIYNMHKGHRWPDDAVRVDRRTPYGNHKKLNGPAWIDETNRLMANPEFAAKMREDLAGRDLLCWCKPNEPNCHARRWLELANRETR